MQGIRVAAGVATAAVLAVTGCGSSGSSDATASPSATTAGSSAPAGGPPSGGPGGGGSGGIGANLQPITEVNLNSEGASPGGANTAAVAQATTAFLATLDGTERDTVEYVFADHKSRQTWSNYPAAIIARPGIKLSALSADQLKAADAVFQTALSSDGYTQDGNIQ